MWKQRQARDPYVQMAHRDGWRSRAVYKLEQIDQKERILRPDMIAIDLGAAPGGWCQYVGVRLKDRVRLIALDLLEMDTLPSVEFIQGDFTEHAVFDRLLDSLGDSKADLVMSDMAPNISGTKAIDQPKSMYLADFGAGSGTPGPEAKRQLHMQAFSGTGHGCLYRRRSQGFWAGQGDETGRIQGREQ